MEISEKNLKTHFHRLLIHNAQEFKFGPAGPTRWIIGDVFFIMLYRRGSR